MAVDLMGGHAVSSSTAAAGEYLAFKEAAAAGLRSLELLASSLSPRADRVRPTPPLARIADQTVSRFRRVINLLDRTGHARFRRAPVAVATHEADSGSPAAASPPRPAPALPPTAVSQKSLTLDFTKPAASSATSTSFLSSVTAAGGEGSVSKGQGQTLAAVSSCKPPLPKRKHPCTATAAPNAAAAAAATTAHPACHCSRKRRKHPRGATRTVRVPAPSPANSASRAAATTTTDVPADEYSWRKYGQKPIKGSPFPRGYYRCSTVKGCPARKHVERDAADPAAMLVTYEGDHRHDALAAGAAPGLA